MGIFCSLAIGDTLLASAAVRGVRESFPGRRIVFFCGPQNAAAARLLPGVDELVMIDLLHPLMTVRAMRSQRLDLLLDLTPWQRLTAFYSMLSGARFTAGFETSGQRRSRGYDLTVKHRSDRHEVDNFRALTQALGIDSHFPPILTLPEVEMPDVLKCGRRIIVFHPWPSGTRSVTREWPAARWLDLAGRLSRRNPSINLHFVVTGGPADSVRSQQMVSDMQDSGYSAESFVGKDGLGSVCQVLINAMLVVSVNTGVMHLAAILGAPTLSLNGPTNNARWGPVGLNALGIQSAGVGCGYLHFGFEMDAGATDCMERITVDMVVAGAEAVMLRADLNANAAGLSTFAMSSGVVDAE